MRPSHSLGRLAVAMLSMSSVATASWPRFLPALDAFIVRRDTSSTSTSPADGASLNTGVESTAKTTAKTTATSTKASTKATGTASASGTGGSDDSDSVSATGTATGTGTAKTTAKTTSKTTKTGNSTTTSRTSYSAVDPAGGITMLTPSTVADATQLYKIGDYITWAWNYTSLQGTPTAVDVLVSCSYATSTYTLTQNMTFETIGRYTWDTAAYETAHANAQLLTQEYTLIIFDADSSVSATAEAGYLDTFDGFTFGMYAAQSYTSIADGWTCASCSGGVSDTERRALGFALTMGVITVLSFTWFVTGMRLA